MTTVLDSLPYYVTGSTSPVGFRHDSSGVGPWRSLTIDGEPAYDLGTLCDTCHFIFKRLAGAKRSVEAPAVANILRTGLAALDRATVSAAAQALPDSRYRAVLLDVPVDLTWPGDDRDYFTHEVGSLARSPSSSPTTPEVPYYRGATLSVRRDSRLFEFVVPMFPPSQLNTDVVLEARRRAERGDHPTALALSVLDVREPAMGRSGAVRKHWCLAHFLLDGNHRVYGASLAGKPARLLAFVALRWGTASEYEVDEAIEALASSGRNANR